MGDGIFDDCVAIGLKVGVPIYVYWIGTERFRISDALRVSPGSERRGSIPEGSDLSSSKFEFGEYCTWSHIVYC